ncbi:MAG: 50S ribosomal protein L11 methyltransferase [Vicinamibacterales bacterium]
MAEGRAWPALAIRAPGTDTPWDELIAAVLDDHPAVAVEDLAALPLPPGGVWDPTAPPPEPVPTEPIAWRVFFREAAERDVLAAELRERYPALVLEPVDVPDEDWAARSQRELTAIRAGTFLVAPPWDRPDAPPAGVTVLVIEPSTGFGTGHHASTRLCLEALSALDLTGLDVLDVGTGSGVLALAAASRQAGRVRGLEVDPDALDAARGSALRNPDVPAVEWLAGDIRTHTAAPADLVLANLTGGLLVRAASDLVRAVRPGGHLVVSGFLEDEAEAVHAALGGTLVARYAEHGWIALVLRQPD